jgi:hypothetical protein
MQVSLVTGNNVYFANGFSSLYIPEYLAEGLSKEINEALENYEQKYLRYLEFHKDTSKEEFADQFISEEKLKSEGYVDSIKENPRFAQNLRKLFIKEKDENIDDHFEHYRWQEYNCFKSNNQSPSDLNDLSFNDIELPDTLGSCFSKIQQIEELRVSQVQLDFTRVKPNERIWKDGEIINTANGQNIYSIDDDQVYVLPANETFGEGLFFGFDHKKIEQWIENSKTKLTPRFNKLTENISTNDQGASIKQKIKFNGSKHLLIHTFSHILMRELEFSCGYPTASLKERLYISDRMAGVLIYTAEGSEGSMGGLVWQGQPDKITELIKNGLERAYDCSSDPLCWESDGQGIFDLNLAACFSCALVSETACEERNLGLDRRSLIDPNFGFFKDLIQ